jgi:hypothetical protein
MVESNKMVMQGPATSREPGPASLANKDDLLPTLGRAHHFFAATSFDISVSMTRSAKTFHVYSLEPAKLLTHRS